MAMPPPPPPPTWSPLPLCRRRRGVPDAVQQPYRGLGPRLARVLRAVHRARPGVRLQVHAHQGHHTPPQGAAPAERLGPASVDGRAAAQVSGALAGLARGGRWGGEGALHCCSRGAALLRAAVKCTCCPPSPHLLTPPPHPHPPRCSMAMNAHSLYLQHLDKASSTRNALLAPHCLHAIQCHLRGRASCAACCPPAAQLPSACRVRAGCR